MRRRRSLLSLWLSLQRGIAAESQWDVGVLRCCSLLEAIGRERLASNRPVLDADGRPLAGHDGAPATTRQLRGLIYVLVQEAIDAIAPSPRVLLSHPTRTLWEEVGIWGDIRNMVAHEGHWRHPVLESSLTNPQRRSAAAFELAGRGDGLEAGWLRYADAVSAATEAVLRHLVVERR